MRLSDIQNDMSEAIGKLADMFIVQCRDGAQSEPLAAYDACACGQFIGPNARKLRQRGIYGTASALRVIADHPTPEAREITRKLLNYLRNRKSIENSLVKGKSGEPQRVRRKCEADDRNIIKLSETLYALHFVTAAAGGKEDLVKSINAKLDNSRRPGGGWGYFSDDTDWNPLPTAYALRAQHVHGFDVSAPCKLLVDSLEKADREGRVAHNWDLSAQVLALYALHAVNSRASGGDIRPLAKKWVDRLWKTFEPLLGQDLEQNIEYWHAAETFYVRVPWQLYLLELISPSVRLFYSKAAQTRLRSILKSVKGSGFLYPNSGSMISSRTNAILFDVIKRIQPGLPSPWLYQPMYSIDRVREAAGSRWVALSGAGLGFTIASYSTYEWIKQSKDVSELAPEFIGGALLGLFALLRKSR